MDEKGAPIIDVILHVGNDILPFTRPLAAGQRIASSDYVESARASEG